MWICYCSMFQYQHVYLYIVNRINRVNRSQTRKQFETPRDEVDTIYASKQNHSQTVVLLPAHLKPISTPPLLFAVSNKRCKTPKWISGDIIQILHSVHGGKSSPWPHSPRHFRCQNLATPSGEIGGDGLTCASGACRLIIANARCEWWEIV